MKINTESEYQTRYLYPSLIQQGKTPDEAMRYIRELNDFTFTKEFKKQLTKRFGVSPYRYLYGGR